MRENRNACGNLKEGDNLEKADKNGKIIHEWIVKKL
jgi:hypothetical protein